MAPLHSTNKFDRSKYLTWTKYSIDTVLNFNTAVSISLSQIFASRAYSYAQ